MLEVSFRRIRPDRVAALRAWMAELMQRQDEVRGTFAQEGVRQEVAYLLPTPEGPVLVYVMEAADVARAREVYAASQLPLDLEHRQRMRAVQAGTYPAERLYEVSLPPRQSGTA
jgi:hypothetical protein